MNFIKKIFHGGEEAKDESVHKQFIRFGKGEYGKRALLGIWKTKFVKVKGSFEFANDFVLFVARLENSNKMIFEGSVWSKDEIPGLSGEKKAGKWIHSVKNYSSSQIKQIADKAYYFLLNAEGEGIKLKIKPKLPKPGKSEGKIDDKFCQLELDEKFYKAAKEDFFWDLPEGKKSEVEHRFIITEIVIPKTNEKDFAKIREMAKRKGKIIRTASVDGKEIKSEKAFEA